MGKFKEAAFEEAEKVLTAFVTWGLGILFMVAYCTFILWLSKIHLYLMIAGALLFLTVSFRLMGMGDG